MAPDCVWMLSREEKKSLLYAENQTTIPYLPCPHASHSLDCASRALSSAIR